jgi:hypothetical protein
MVPGPGPDSGGVTRGAGIPSCGRPTPRACHYHRSTTVNSGAEASDGAVAAAFQTGAHRLHPSPRSCRLHAVKRRRGVTKADNHRALSAQSSHRAAGQHRSPRCSPVKRARSDAASQCLGSGAARGRQGAGGDRGPIPHLTALVTATSSTGLHSDATQRTPPAHVA